MTVATKEPTNEPTSENLWDMALVVINRLVTFLLFQSRISPRNNLSVKLSKSDPLVQKLTHLEIDWWYFGDNYQAFPALVDVLPV